MQRPLVLLFLALYLAPITTLQVAADEPTLRADWTTSRLIGSPEPPLPYVVERVFPQFSFKEPVILTHQDDSDRIFLAERAGQIYSFLPSRGTTDPTQNTAAPDLVIDLPAEIGAVNAVYGLAFDPDFDNNRYCYICYIVAGDAADGTVVSRFEMSDTEPPTIDAGTEKQLIRWKSGGHNGGCLKFGPDGFLYITTGDGAPPRPPDGLATGQGVNDLLSCLLRIDVHPRDDSVAYQVPADNPFVDIDGARPEIWAFGFRNPWKMSFNEKTGELWIGDVGWELYEMVYSVQRGGNYGWSVMEGPQPVRGEIEPGPGAILPPAASHSHVVSKSVTGGHVYRDKQLKALSGAYIYGDYVTGKIWGLRTKAGEVTWNEEIADSTLAIIAFGRDRHDNFYVLDYAGGIYQLSENPDRHQNSDFPQLLSETGLFSSVAELAPAPGVVDFSVAAPQWSDHATASYLAAVPGGQRITLAKGSFSFPSGTVLAKTLSLPLDLAQPATRRIMETQLLVYQGGQWDAFSYAWNDEQTDAQLVSAAGQRQSITVTDKQSVEGSFQYSWRFHSRAECQTCHNARHGQLIGFLPAQLNHPRSTASAGSLSQLDWLHHRGLIEWTELANAAGSDPAPARDSWDNLPSLVNPYDVAAETEARVRSYLFINCAHCHMPGGGGTAHFDVRFTTSLEASLLLGTRPSQGNFLIQNARIVAPHDALGSVLLYRMAKTGKGRMPQIGPSLVDSAGVDLLRDWIQQMDPPDDVAPRIAQRAEMLRQSNQFVDSATDAATRATLADSLLNDTSGALALSLAIQQRPLEAGVLSPLLKDRPLHIRDLFDRFLPADERIARLGEIINPAEILSARGSVQRGRELYTLGVTMQCRNCHRLNDVGKQVGPDLADIGTRLKKEKILESILHPSRTIDPKFSSYIVETVDGRIMTGLLKSKTSEQVVLVTTDAKEVSIASNQIDLLVRQPKSLMPDLQLKDMTIQQAADLLAFLMSQKKK